MIAETRLEIHEMKRRDWRLFYEALPMREACTEMQRELKQFAHGRYAVPTPDIGMSSYAEAGGRSPCGRTGWGRFR
jgi:hypothetical protein